MKAIFSILTFTIISTLVLAGGKGKKLQLNIKESKVSWVGKKVTGEHSGDLMFKSGEIAIDDGKISQIQAQVDMNTMTCTDMQGKWGEKLVQHLKSDDFFAVEKHPTSMFQLKSVEESGEDSYTMTGDLTIKGITKPVSFVASVLKEGDTLKMQGEVTFDRTDYDIKYGSGKFIDGLGDKMIYDEVTFIFSITAH